MRDWFETLVGPDYATPVMWIVSGLILLVLLIVLMRLLRNLNGGTFIAGGRNRKARLAVMDAAAVDSRRRLVLVRRDDVEHLILIGGPTDVVVEQDIRLMSRAQRPVLETEMPPEPAAEPARPRLVSPPPAPAPARPPEPAPAVRPAPPSRDAGYFARPARSVAAAAPVPPPPAAAAAIPAALAPVGPAAEEPRPKPAPEPVLPGSGPAPEPFVPIPPARSAAPALHGNEATLPPQRQAGPVPGPGRAAEPAPAAYPEPAPLRDGPVAEPPPVLAEPPARTATPPASDSNVDDALLRELEVTLDRAPRREPQPGPDDEMLEEEMNKLLGELSGERR